MSEVLHDLVASLSPEDDNLFQYRTPINKQIQETESRFKRATSGVDNFEKSARDANAVRHPPAKIVTAAAIRHAME